MSIGKNIRRLRKSQDMSMKAAADQLKLPYTTYVNYEKGARKPPIATLIQIADYFDVTLDELTGRVPLVQKAIWHTQTSWRMTAAMQAKDMSYGELAKLTWISKSALQRYATAENGIPSDRILLIAQALNVSPEWLAGWMDENK